MILLSWRQLKFSSVQFLSWKGLTKLIKLDKRTPLCQNLRVLSKVLFRQLENQFLKILKKQTCKLIKNNGRFIDWRLNLLLGHFQLSRIQQIHHSLQLIKRIESLSGKKQTNSDIEITRFTSTNHIFHSSKRASQ